MNTNYKLVLIGILLYVVTYCGYLIWHSKIRVPRRLEFIKRYHFNSSIRDKIAEDYPALSSYDVNLVLNGLKQFFIIAHFAGNRRIGMPSLIVDAAWHHFILHTLDYHDFCKNSFGRIFNHTPNSSIENPTNIAIELKRTWHIACNIENIKPKYPTRIPLLFALDSKLKIEKGNYYELIENELRFGAKQKTSSSEAAYPVFLCGACGGATNLGFGDGGDGGGGCGGGGCSGG